jgi:AbrB family looped-hinge helix DNA binding protein
MEEILQGATTLDSAGRVVIPAAIRKRMGIKPGDEVMLWFEVAENELRIYTREHGIRKAQEIVCSRIPAHISLVDELIAERREEARREDLRARRVRRHRRAS